MAPVPARRFRVSAHHVGDRVLGRIVAGARPLGGDPLLVATTLARPASVLFGPAALAALAFGIWLAIYVEGYELWDGWILASVLLWVAAVATGSIAGQSYAKATTTTIAESASLRSRGLPLHAVSTVGYVAILVLMIYKPGA